MAKYIVKFTPKRGNSENSDLEKLINKMSSSCEKIAPATFVINSEKTVRRIVKSLASRMGNKGNFVEEFYTSISSKNHFLKIFEATTESCIFVKVSLSTVFSSEKSYLKYFLSGSSGRK